MADAFQCVLWSRLAPGLRRRALMKTCCGAPVLCAGLNHNLGLSCLMSCFRHGQVRHGCALTMKGVQLQGPVRQVCPAFILAGCALPDGHACCGSAVSVLLHWSQPLTAALRPRARGQQPSQRKTGLSMPREVRQHSGQEHCFPGMLEQNAEHSMH